MGCPHFSQKRTCVCVCVCVCESVRVCVCFWRPVVIVSMRRNMWLSQYVVRSVSGVQPASLLCINTFCWTPARNTHNLPDISYQYLLAHMRAKSIEIKQNTKLVGPLTPTGRHNTECESLKHVVHCLPRYFWALLICSIHVRSQKHYLGRSLVYNT